MSLIEVLGLATLLRDEKGQMPEEDGAKVGDGGLASRKERERRAAMAEDVVAGMVDDRLLGVGGREK
ncbi:hypothetical protein SEPCBS119000_005167 [Sporothrix epigloea]|uniref:Uncharacterized protein n=1 Tax=Sporothrix epigloea TaxID=1892477 RepID=A0ABP0DXA1_9PEZI